MSRSARIVIPDYPYHITQRGNYRQNVFIDDDDRIKYLSWIDEYSKRYQLSILAFCLMNNHVHFITIPGKEDSLSKVFSIVHMRHSQYLNKRMGKSGHLWQGRFYSCVLDENYLIASLRYVENNPVRAGILKEAWKWKWSSAAYSVGIADGLLVHYINSNVFLREFFVFHDNSSRNAFDSFKSLVSNPSVNQL